MTIINLPYLDNSEHTHGFFYPPLLSTIAAGLIVSSSETLKSFLYSANTAQNWGKCSKKVFFYQRKKKQ